MAFQVSPGVNTSEIDLTNVVVSAGTSTGGFAGRFRWGPIEDVMLITDEDNLVETFQKPDDNNFEHFFTAANFLQYTSALNLVEHMLMFRSQIPKIITPLMMMNKVDQHMLLLLTARSLQSGQEI